MKAPSVQTPETTGNGREDSVMITEKLDLKPAMSGTGAGMSRVLGTSIGTRFWRIVALGALLVGAASLYTSISQGEADIQDRTGSPASFHLTSADPDAAELPYDELTRNFFGSGSTGGAVVAIDDHDAAELPYDELTRNFFGSGSTGAAGAIDEHDAAELPYDELSRNFFGIPVTTR